ncbi:uncharacterized protein B0T15DRAFT_388053 [Chaetomium strumarium]|uniref:Secreted protein n=1 Tax=Chaetomium strumarium TaxID=1170767 RepID=A0AAJ0H0V7_9PEZI|nr:hypothetical protein B0T15DRAFT_388053 [Chaetomium strumarium]
MGLLSQLTVVLAAATHTALAAPAPADVSGADIATPRITSITFSGNGCARDPKFSGNFNNPSVTFTDFAAASPGANQTLNCEVHLQATGASPGWQVALSRNTVKGYVVLPPGTALNYYTTSYFSQDAGKTCTLRGSVSNTGSGTVNQGVTLVSSAGGDKAWSPCTGSDGYTGILNVNFRGALTGDGRAYFEAQTEEWDLEWRRC